MEVWIVEATEPLLAFDRNCRELRCGILARALEANGHTVTWWTSTFSHMEKRFRFEDSHSCNITPGIRLNLMPGPGYSKNTSLKRIAHSRSLARYFSTAASDNARQPDVIFTCWPIPELAERAVKYGLMKEIPVIVDVRDLWPDIYMRIFPAVIRPLAKIFMLSEFRRAFWTLSRSTGITAVSKSYLSWALEKAGRKRRDVDGVFPLGYSLKSEDQGKVAQQIQILSEKYGLVPHMAVFSFIGMLGSSYDLETLVRAAKKLKQEGDTQIKIIIAGDGEKIADLRRLAEGLDNIVFTGWIGKNEIWALMRLSVAGLAAYMGEAPQSLPNKPFEYWAAGLPILSSLTGELETLIGQEKVGLQYESGNVDSLMHAIRWMVSNPEEREVMGRNARKLIEEEFNSDIICNHLTRHIERVQEWAD
jgi:glycosyltransferase involved in cell wall biosynthesis